MAPILPFVMAATSVMNIINRNNAASAASSAESQQAAADRARTQAELADVPTAGQVEGAEVQGYADRGINLGKVGAPGTPGTPGTPAVYSTGPTVRPWGAGGGDAGLTPSDYPPGPPAGTLISPAIPGTPGTPGVPDVAGNSPAVQYALQRRQNLINKINAGGNVTQAGYNLRSANQSLAAASGGGDPLSIIAGLFSGGGSSTAGGAGSPTIGPSQPTEAQPWTADYTNPWMYTA